MFFRFALLTSLVFALFSSLGFSRPIADSKAGRCRELGGVWIASIQGCKIPGSPVIIVRDPPKK